MERTGNRGIEVWMNASHSEAFEVDLVTALQGRNLVVKPIGMPASANAWLPVPAQVATVPAQVVRPTGNPFAPAVAEGTKVATPTIPWPGANVKPTKKAALKPVPDAWSAWDPDLRMSWLWNADARPMADGTSGAHRWKVKVGFAWFDLSQRAALIQAAKDAGAKV